MEQRAKMVGQYGLVMTCFMRWCCHADQELIMRSDQNDQNQFN